MKRRRPGPRRYATTKRVHCPHCDQWIQQKTFDEHRKVYYNADKGEWMASDLGSFRTDFEPDSDYSGDVASPLSEPSTPVLSDSSSSDVPDLDFDMQDVNFSPSERSGMDTSSVQGGFPSPPSGESSSAGEEDWDESDCEVLQNSLSLSTSECEDSIKANAFVTWMVRLLLAFQAVYVVPYQATQWLFAFLHAVLKSLFAVAPTPFLEAVIAVIPTSLYTAWKSVKLEKDEFLHYVVCPKCNSIYRYEDCVLRSGTQVRSKMCSYVAFPNHPHKRYRSPCNATLLKTVYFRNGTTKLVARKEYPYMSIVKTIEKFWKRPDFYEKCQAWRKRQVIQDLYTDVYDGQIWKDFQVVNGEPFLSSDSSLGLMLNIDWFQPFKHSQYSVGAVYLVVMNLPREHRFLRENLILAGIIPGPSEPEISVNSFLDPLVDELNMLWKGVNMKLQHCEKKVRAAVLCTGCDIPAGKKVGGFMGFGSSYGCSRCFKLFEGEGFRKSYADFDRSAWPKRTNIEHRRHVQQITQACTMMERQTLQRKFGVRYSALLKLEYYDAIRMSTIVDPLHNLYLGTAKHMFKDVWFDKELISATDLNRLQSCVDDIITPPDLGRIPRKIASNFGGFTGEQWKNWIELYSLIALQRIESFPSDHMECWRHFVLACRLLSTPVISRTKLLLADALLLQFCRRAVRLYGDSVSTPNMHLHAHLRECVEDYGPVHSFWLFSFERYNGLLGRQPNNSKSIEIQIMRRFLRESELMHQELPKEFRLEFESLYPLSGSALSEECTVSSYSCTSIHWNQMTTIDVATEKWGVDLSYFSVPVSSHRGILSRDHQHYLKKMYQTLYPNLSEEDITINATIRKYYSVSTPFRLYGSRTKASHNSSFVMANWPSQAHIQISSNPDNLSPGQVQYYFLHSVILGSESYQHLCAYVLWFQPHPERDTLGKPLEVWYRNAYQCCGPSNFIPIQRILTSFTALHDDDKMIICPSVIKGHM